MGREFRGGGVAQCYNKHHAVHIFAVGDMVSIREDRVKTDNKQLSAKVIAKPQLEYH